MLDIDIEPRYGVLFIRLSGTLNESNYKSLSSVDSLLKKVGIRNVVFNIQSLENIDNNGEKALYNSITTCENNQGQVLLCVKDNEEVTEKISFLLDKIGIVEDELSALKKITL